MVPLIMTLGSMKSVSVALLSLVLLAHGARYNGLFRYQAWIGTSTYTPTTLDQVPLFVPSTEYIPPARFDAASASGLALHFVFGGCSIPDDCSTDLYNDLWAFNSSSLEWTRFAGNANEVIPAIVGRYAATIFLDENRNFLYIMNGITAAFTPVVELVQFSFQTHTWNLISFESSETPLPVTHRTLVWTSVLQDSAFLCCGVVLRNNGFSDEEAIRSPDAGSSGAVLLLNLDTLSLTVASYIPDLSYTSLNSPGLTNYGSYVWNSKDESYISLVCSFGGRLTTSYCGGEYTSDEIICGEVGSHIDPWVIRKGNPCTETIPTYEQKGIPSSTSNPGSRRNFAGASDSSGNLWIMGGIVSSNSLETVASDVWFWNTTDNTWTWVSGPSISETNPCVGDVQLNQIDSSYCSGSRKQHLLFSGTKDQDNLFVFSGQSSTSNLTGDLWIVPQCAVRHISAELLDFDCFQCVQGKHIDLESLECTNCELGKFSSINSSRECDPCPIGQFSNVLGALNCTTCPLGKWSDAIGSSACPDCPRGTLRQKFSDVGCSLCSASYYSDTSGLSACIGCPSGRYSVVTGGTSLNDCQNCSAGKSSAFASTSCQNCLPGYISTESGAQCVSCSEQWSSSALSCPSEGTSIPFLAPGYYRSPSNPFIFDVCSPSFACQYTGSNGSTECALGYTGYRCGRCVDVDWYRLGLECRKCSNYGETPMVLLIIMAFLASWFLLNKSIPSYTGPSHVFETISWIQIISTYVSMPLSWPQRASSFLNAGSVTNLSLESIQLECTLKLDFWQYYNLKMTLPLIVCGCFLVFFIPHWFTRQKTQYGDLADKMVFNFLRIRKPTHLNITHQAFICRYVFAFSKFLYWMFLFLVSSAFEPFNCMKSSNGQYFMLKDSSIPCFDESWKSHLASIVLGVLIYAVIIPLLFLCTLLQSRSKKRSQVAIDLVGFAMIPYTENYQWWEILKFLKKEVHAILVQFFPLHQQAHFEIFLLISLLSLSLVLELIYRPFKYFDTQNLSFFWTVTAIVCLFSGVFFSNSSSKSQENLFDILLVCFFALSILWSIWIIWKSYKRRSTIRAEEKRMKKSLKQFEDEIRKSIQFINLPDIRGDEVWHSLRRCELESLIGFGEKIWTHTKFEGPSDIAINAVSTSVDQHARVFQ